MIDVDDNGDITNVRLLGAGNLTDAERDKVKAFLEGSMGDLKEDLNNRFTFHPPKNDQARRYEALRRTALDLAYQIVEDTPVSREQSLAFTHLEQCIMWANAAIARHE